MIEQNISLATMNTFGLDVRARFYARISSVSELQQLMKRREYQENRRMILGGGSNVLFARDFDGIILHNQLKGLEVLSDNGDDVVLKIGAGEVWDDVVAYSVEHNWGGIENLSLIPGLAGAAPIQNIGAYGTEIRQVLVSVEAVNLGDGTLHTFSNDECMFGYRESVFKSSLSEKYFISSITLRLTKKNHRINTTYGAIEEVLRRRNISSPGLREVRDAVVEIRTSKLPDPARVGNAGSFFKNPTVDAAQFESLKQRYPAIPSYPVDNQHVKIPAGWLIEQCGWKGKSLGRAGVHDKQALVLINRGGATGEEILMLADKILSDVREKFGVRLSQEVNVIK